MSRLLHISDLHFGEELPSAVEALINAAHDLSPDQILISGDFTMQARRREWRAARAFLDRLPCPVLSIPGNHDIPASNQLLHRLLHPFQRYREAICQDLEPSVVVGEIEVVGMNTARPFGAPSWDWSHGSVSVAQCLGLPLRFKANTPLRAVMIHHPIRASPGIKRHLLGRDGMLLAALQNAHVDVLLAGHFHKSFIATTPLPFGTANLILSHASTACSRRVKDEPPGFHLLEMQAGSVSIARHRFVEQEGCFESHDQSAFIKTESGWLAQTQDLQNAGS